MDALSHPTSPPWRVLVKLCRRQLSQTPAAKLGWWLTAVALATSLLLLAGLGREAMREDVVLRGLRWALWLGLVPLGMAIANDPAQRDRDEGIELLVAVHGAGWRRLRRARVTAAALETTLRVIVPALVLCLALLAFGGRARSVAMQSAGLIAFSLVAGPLLGGLASLCGHVGRERGRLLLFAVLLLPWGTADRLSGVPLSIPGLMDASLSRLGEVVAP